MNEGPAVQDKVTYRGNCYCGTFVFEATMPEIKEVMVCNCSICYKKNYAFAMVPNEDFKVVKGDIAKDLTTYKFGKESMAHMFCSKCGIAVINTYTGFPDSTAINVRAIQGPIDLWEMPKKHYDGKSYKPDYVSPSYEGLAYPARKFEETGGGKLYHGSCHCGDVTVALRVAKPLEEDPDRVVVECNCSICQRIGSTWIYPKRDQVVFKVASAGSSAEDRDPTDDMAAFPIRIGSQLFCRRCGVFIANRLNIRTDEEFNRLPEKMREHLADKRDWQPLNLRIFEGVDIGKLSPRHEDGWNTLEPKYVNP